MEGGIMPTGKIKYYNSEKSFGFITQDSGEDDVFLHASALKGWDPDDLRVGQRVKYEVVKGKKGLVAQDAEILLTPIEKRCVDPHVVLLLERRQHHLQQSRVTGAGGRRHSQHLLRQLILTATRNHCDEKDRKERVGLEHRLTLLN